MNLKFFCWNTVLERVVYGLRQGLRRARGTACRKPAVGVNVAGTGRQCILVLENPLGW